VSAAESLEPYDDPAQRRRADTFGMFVFLASEIMLFGGLFAALSVYRIAHPVAVVEASRKLNVWFGSANTAILLTSSLFVALAGLTARDGKTRPTATLLGVAAALGAAFLVVKGFKYAEDFREGVVPVGAFGDRPAALFISLYYVSTALHGLHVAIGVVTLATVAIGVGTRRSKLPEREGTVALAGLYWHLVDVIWVFLFPMLYLART
jgi:cytochrome c oxidase subunit 3